MTQATSAETVHTPAGEGEEPFPSPLFRDLMAQFDDATRRVILTPGATNAATLALLQGKRCRLLVADAARALSALSDGSHQDVSLSRRIESLIFGVGEEPVDAVLCWDLLNYLSPPVLSAFAARLVDIMAPAGTVHAYIHSARATMPRHPQTYLPLGPDLVVRQAPDPDEREAPRYSTWDLEKHGVGLRVDRSRLLRNGMQEYLLRVDPSRSGPRDIKALYRKRSG